MQNRIKLGPWVSNFILNLNGIDLKIQMDRKGSKSFSCERIPLLVTRHFTSVSVYGRMCLEKHGLIREPLTLFLPYIQNATFTIQMDHGTLCVQDVFAEQFKANVVDGNIHLDNVDISKTILTGNSPVYASINNAEYNYQIRGTASTDIDSCHRDLFSSQKIRTFRNDTTAKNSQIRFFG